MSRAIWYVRQLLPLHYRTWYTDGDGMRHFAVWRMWLGRCFAIDDVTLGPSCAAPSPERAPA